MLKITDNFNLKDIYDFQLSFVTPYFFDVDFEDWRNSFESDIDGEGRELFKELKVKAVYDDDVLSGFVQYGKTAFGFADNGEISSEISYPVIRNLYFKKDRQDAGQMLLDEAMNSFDSNERVYAFFHYFGMTCFARHGKVFESHTHIDNLLREQGFEVEHENVYYSSVLSEGKNSEITAPLPATITGHFAFASISAAFLVSSAPARIRFAYSRFQSLVSGYSQT